MKILNLFLPLLSLGVISCNNLFGDGAADPSKSGSFGPTGGVISQDDYDRIGDPDYVRETEFDELEIASVHEILLDYHLDGKERIGALPQYSSISSLFADLDDQFSDYYDPTQAAILFEDFTTPDEGGAFGFSTLFENDTLRISFVFPKTPAAAAGMKRGDILFEVNGKPLLTDDNPVELFFSEIEGDIGTNATIKVLRNNAFVTLFMTKENVKFATAWKDSLTPYASIIQVTGFEISTLDDSQEIFTVEGKADTAVGTLKEFREALRQSENDLVTVIDLRGNPGGFVSICTGMIDELIDDGTFFITRNIDGGVISNDTSKARNGGLASNREFVLLADEGSASCSELFIQGVKSNKNFPLIGRTTYGKGIAQGFKLTAREGVVRTTGTQYYYEDETSYNEKGHVPEYEIESPVAQLAKAIELAGEIAGVGAGGSSDQESSYDAAARLQAILDQRPRSNKDPMAIILDDEILNKYE